MGIQNCPPGTCSCFPDCHRPVEGGHKCCAHHMESSRRRKATHRAKPRFPGQCRASDCPNPAQEGKTRCARCADRVARYERLPEVRERRRVALHRLKAEVIQAYGGCCECCGTTIPEFLSLDHVTRYAGVGPRRGDHLYTWLKSHGFPAGFRVLCIGCNFALGHYGYCPHGTLTQKVRGVPPAGQGKTQKLWRANLRRVVYQAYGGAACRCCGEAHLECLTLDHVNDDGAAHRRANPKFASTSTLYRHLVKSGFPPGFQVLCMNCNFAKGLWGHCPHGQGAQAHGS